MIHDMERTAHMTTLYAKTRRDHLRLRLAILAGSSLDEPVFVLAVHAEHQDASLIEVRTKRIESAALVILDRYSTIVPDEPMAA
jgi:hypothetical protein